MQVILKLELSVVNIHRLLIAAVALLGALSGLTGCVIEPFAESIPVPAAHWTPSTQPTTSGATLANSPSHLQPTTVTVVGPSTTRPTETPAATIDLATRNKAGELARANLVKRYPAATDANLKEYLVLVGSVVALKSMSFEGDCDYLLLDTEQPLSGAIAPKTIFLSRGLFKRLEDEAELAGVLAREISNLTSDRAFKAAGLTVLAPPTTRPATQPTTRPGGVAAAPATQPSTPATVKADLALATQAAAKITQIILADGMGNELEQAADREGARLAAEARYAPDGFLRVLTRLKPGDWTRIKALDADVTIIAKAHPHADVRLPVRFETYVKSAEKARP